MDLVSTVRKEGSRGGRANFSWEDVKGDQHRENYLGHSLMAPVGRWQKNRDLNWYAKSDEHGNAISEADARKAEIRKVKEAEEDAMARALGIDPPPRSSGGNANMIELGERKVLEPQEGGANGKGAPEEDGKDHDGDRNPASRDRDRGNEEPVGRATMVRPMNVTADTGINRAHVLWTKSGEGAETRSDAMSHLGNPTGGMVIGMSRDEPRDDRTTMTILQDIMTTRDDTATNTTTKAGAEAGVGADRLTDQRID